MNKCKPTPVQVMFSSHGAHIRTHLHGRTTSKCGAGKFTISSMIRGQFISCPEKFVHQSVPELAIILEKNHPVNRSVKQVELFCCIRLLFDACNVHSKLY